MKNKIVATALILASVVIVKAKEMPKDFFVYTERGSRDNHYIPSGWMGDFGDLKFNQGWAIKPAVGKTCIQIKYSAERKQGAGWAGIYWQSPANNWGDKKGGFDLSAYKTLTFMVRGEKGGELIDKFMIGNITGQTEEGDSDSVESEPIELTKEWKTYSLDLSRANLKHIIGGFGFAMNSDSNTNGAVFYIDEIRLSNESLKTASAK